MNQALDEMHEKAQSAAASAAAAGRNLADKASDIAQRAGDHIEKAAKEGGNIEISEGKVTRAIEHYTSQVSSGTYLTFALGSMAASAMLHLLGRKDDAVFIGQWAPAILIMGLYNKLVKLHGSD